MIAVTQSYVRHRKCTILSSRWWIGHLDFAWSQWNHRFVLLSMLRLTKIIRDGSACRKWVMEIKKTWERNFFYGAIPSVTSLWANKLNPCIIAHHPYLPHVKLTVIYGKPVIYLLAYTKPVKTISKTISSVGRTFCIGLPVGHLLSRNVPCSSLFVVQFLFLPSHILLQPSSCLPTCIFGLKSNRYPVLFRYRSW